MRHTAGSVRNALRCDAGAAAIEYCILAGMIALVIIAGVTTVGSDLLAFFQGAVGSL